MKRFAKKEEPKKMSAYDFVCEKVADAIISKLEQGIIPWRRPWGGGGLAISATSGAPYNFINQILLAFGGEWATFKYIKEHGGKVKKGEEAMHIVMRFPIKRKTDETDILGDEKEIIEGFRLAWMPVFEINRQVEPMGGDVPYTLEPKRKIEVETQPLAKDDKAEEIVKAYFDRDNAPKLERDSLSGQAFYTAFLDMVVVPCITQYQEVGGYYSTLFHEMTHSTGHKDRLNRKGIVEANKFGTEKYSREELVAEMGASFLCGVAGIDTESTMDNSVAYLQSWLTHLKDNKKEIFGAIQEATKATKYILGE